MLFEIDTHNEDAIKEAIDRLIEFKNELKKIHVGDIVKVTHTGKMYTHNTTFFVNEIMKNKHNDVVLEQLASLSSRYDFEKSYYLEDGVSSIDDIIFRVEYISEDKKAVISIVEDGIPRNNRTYIIKIEGLERW